MAAAQHVSDLQTPEDFLRALRRDHAGYLLSIGLLALGNLLLLPLITTALPPDAIGLYSLVEAGTTPGLTLSLLGLKFAYLYHYARQPAEARPALLGTALLVSITSGILTGSALALLFGSAAVMTVFGSAPLESAWVLLPLMLTGAIQTLLITELRAERRVALAGMLAVGNLAIWLAASSLLVLWADLGVPGLLGGQICGQTLAVIIGMACIRRRPLFAWDSSKIRPLVGYGVPMMTGLLLRYALDSVSRFLIAAWVGIEAAGDFLIASRVAVLYEALLALPFFMAWGGLVHHAVQRPRAAAIITAISNQTLAAGGLLLLILVALQPWLFQLFAGAARPELAPLFACVLLGQYFGLAKSPLGAGMLRLPDTGWTVRNNLLALALYLPIAWPAMLWAGASGAALAIALVSLLTGCVLYVQAQRLCPQRPSRLALLLPVLLAILCVSAVLLKSAPLWLLPLPALFAAWLLWQSAHPTAAPEAV